MTSSRRTALAVALGLGICGVVSGLTLLAYVEFIRFGGDLNCEHEEGDSNYGRQTWSRFPLGPVCTWTMELNGVEAEERPGVFMTVWLAATVVLVVATLVALVCAVAMRGHDMEPSD